MEPKKQIHHKKQKQIHHKKHKNKNKMNCIVCFELKESVVPVCGECCNGVCKKCYFFIDKCPLCRGKYGGKPCRVNGYIRFNEKCECKECDSHREYLINKAMKVQKELFARRTSRQNMVEQNNQYVQKRLELDQKQLELEKMRKRLEELEHMEEEEDERQRTKKIRTKKYTYLNRNEDRAYILKRRTIYIEQMTIAMENYIKNE